ncbi:MAG TPA: hypothetical protein DCP38_05505, partial [Acidobacteria bacterium]|nr:hypothetical protein [Acidobacteriota bacterium]
MAGAGVAEPGADSGRPVPSAADPLEAFEYELKFGLRGRSVAAVRQWLRTICRVDPVFPTGRVCSVYYDTPAFHHLRENANSDYLKTKVRLRWYEQVVTAGDRAFLEAKFRFGPRRNKVRLEVLHTGRQLAAMPLHAAELGAMPARLREVGVMTPTALRPIVLVRYRR